jgi:hypothetical protein
MNLNAAIEVVAYGTSEGVTKAWDTRGRHFPEWQHGVHLGIFDRPEHPNQYAHNIGRYFPNPVPSLIERQRIATAFDKAHLLGEQLVKLKELYPMQKTVIQSRLDRNARHGEESEISEGKRSAVFNFNGKNYIVDGHHRLVNDVLRGKSVALVRMFVPRETREN